MSFIPCFTILSFIIIFYIKLLFIYPVKKNSNNLPIVFSVCFNSYYYRFLLLFLFCFTSFELIICKNRYLLGFNNYLCTIQCLRYFSPEVKNNKNGLCTLLNLLTSVRASIVIALSSSSLLLFCLFSLFFACKTTVRGNVSTLLQQTECTDFIHLEKLCLHVQYADDEICSIPNQRILLYYKTYI